jgi:hypothetical protein
LSKYSRTVRYLCLHDHHHHHRCPSAAASPIVVSRSLPICRSSHDRELSFTTTLHHHAPPPSLPAQEIHLPIQTLMDID